MDPLYPIIWTEGALLSQQHFQYWESWLLNQQSQILRSLFPEEEGLALCEFQPNCLAEGRIVLDALIIRTNNANWLRYDPKSMPALALTLEDCPEQIIYLLLPNHLQCSGLSGYEASHDICAYDAVYQELGDRYDLRRRHELALGRPQLRLSIGPGDVRFFESWPLVKIIKRAHSQFEISHDFLPLSLTLKGSPQLQEQLGRIIKSVSEKICFLEKELRRTHCEKRSRELSVLSLFLFELKDVMSHKTTQPRQIYSMLAKTLIQLDSSAHPEVFQPLTPSENFIKLCQALSARLVEKHESLKSYLMQKNNKLYPGVYGIDPGHLQGHQWFLGLDFSHQPPENIQKFMGLAKLATVGTLDQILASALPGIPFTHVSRPPNQINTQEGYEYFKLDVDSTFWKQVKEERTLMLNIPSFLDGDKITLDLVKE